MSKLIKYLKPFRIPLSFVIVLVLIQSLAELYLPTLMADIVDKGVVKGDTNYIWKIGGFMLLVASGGMISSVAASFYSAKVSVSFGKSLRTIVFNHVSHFSLQEFDQIGTASLITRTTNDITQIQQLVIIMLRMMITAPMMFIGGIMMAISKDTKLTFVLLVSLPILVIAITLIARKGIPLFKAMQVKLDQVNRVLRENLTGMRVIRSFNKIEKEKDRFNVANRDLANTAIKVNKLMASLMPLMMLILNLTTVAIIWFGGIRISNGYMQVGDLMAFIQYAMQIMFSFVMVSMMFVMVPRASVSAVRINEVLEMEPVVTDLISRDQFQNKERMPKGTVEFQNVTFSYPGAEIPALSGLTFSIHPGKITAIVGGTGAGKSTLIHLIPRFYDVDSGKVLVDGIDVRELPQEILRAKIGLVPQQAVLFAGTIADNIRFSKETASQEEIIHAAEISQSADFIYDLPDGFEATIAQGGMNISGGQKQRLAIARALIRKPEIYLFDDSFSALDFKTDATLRAALEKETQNSTVIIVAQRMSTIMNADQIIVLDNGEIAGAGDHHQLMETCSVYQEIVMSQLSKEELA